MKKSLRSKEQLKLQKLLADIRKEAGLRQVELSKRLEKPQSFVSKYETGERRLDLVEIHQICKAIGISFVKFAQRFDKIISR